MIPSAAASRAVHQYRRRDLVPYLALRYLLENSAARSDDWIVGVACDQVLRRQSTHFFSVNNYKGRGDDGTIEYRTLSLPGPAEALAESWLLGCCAGKKGFVNPTSVYSYTLCDPDATQGAFEPYFSGLQRRQRDIAKACRKQADLVVMYLDIRACYPSIPLLTAESAWVSASSESSLSPREHELGLRLLWAQKDRFQETSTNLATGPMLSHLLANLVLREVDTFASSRFREVRYFRYVDDIILVGTRNKVDQARADLESKLEGMGLLLHSADSDKSLIVSRDEWLKGAADFQDSSDPIQWKTLVGGLKWLLTGDPNTYPEVSQQIRALGMRLPVLDYRHATRERSYLWKAASYVRTEWFRGRQRTLPELLRQARVLRERVFKQAIHVVQQLETARGYSRRRLLPKARYLAGRLVYLGDIQQVALVGELMREIPELEFHATMLAAVATGDVTQAIRLGGNLAQAVAQPCQAEHRTVEFQGPVTSDAEIQGLAILALNGVTVRGDGWGTWQENELLRFARSGADISLFRSGNKYIRELASLHGLGTEPRHSLMVRTAFDEGDSVTFDAVSSYMLGS